MPRPAYRKLGDYLLLGEIAGGGMGQVFQAVHERLQRPCALKLIRTGVFASGPERARFLVEVEAAAALDHPYVVQVRTAGEVDGQLFLEMELVEGGTLADRLASGALPFREAARLVSRLAAAVQHSHDRGVLHRDLKPGNVLLAEDGTPRLTDFGLARLLDREGDLTGTVSLLGTPGYLAPELAEGHARAATVAADVYGLGVILYEALVGRAAYSGATPLAVLRAVQQGPPPPPSRFSPHLPRDLEILVLRAMNREPAARLPSAGELARELERWLDGQPIRSRPVPPWEEVRAWVRRRPAWAALSAVSALLLLGLMLSLLIGRQRVAQALEFAQRNQARAEAENDLNRRRFVRLLADRAGQLARDGEFARALPDLAAAWENDPAAGERDFAHRIRFGSTLDRAARPRWIALLGKPADRLAWSPDGRRLAAANQDGEITLWDPVQGRPVMDPWQLGAVARALAFTPDGTGLLVASGGVGSAGELRLLDGGDGSRRAAVTLDSVPGPLAVHPSGNLVAVGLRAGEVRCFELPALTPVGPVLRHDQRVVSLAFAPTGDGLATASWDGTAGLWNWRTGQPLHSPLAHPEWLRFVAFSPDGTRLATAADDGVVRLWGSATGRLVHPLRGHQGLVSRLAFSPDGRWLASVSHDRTARVWSVDTGVPLTPPLVHANDVLGASFHPTEPLLITAGRDREVRFWELPSGRAAATPLVHGGEVLAAQLNPAGTEIATASVDGTLRLWPVAGSRPWSAEHSLNARGWILAVNSKGTLLGVGDGSGELRVWPVPEGEPRVMVPGGSNSERVDWAGFSADDRWFGATWRDGTVRVWRLPGWEPVPVEAHHQGAAEVGLFTPDGRAVITGGADGRVLYHALDGSRAPVQFPLCRDEVMALAASPDGRLLAVGAQARRSPAQPAGGSLHLLDLGTGREMKPVQKAASPVRALAFDPRGERLAWDSGHGTVRLEATDGTSPRRLTELAHAGPVRTLEWSADGRRLLTGSADGTARVWDLATGELALPSLVHAGPVRAAWVAAGNLILTSSQDHSARLWDARTGEAVSDPLKHDGDVVAAVWLEDTTTVVTLGADRRLRHWRCPPFLGTPAEAQRLARAFASEEVDRNGGRLPLRPEQLADAWRAAAPAVVTFPIPP